MVNKKLVSLHTIEAARSALMALPSRAKAVMSLDEALQELKPSFVEAIKKGYSQEDIISFLSVRGIFVKPYRFKKLLATKRTTLSEPLLGVARL